MQFENLKKNKIENFLSQQKLLETTMKNGEKTIINNTLANINPNFSRISNDDQQNENNEEINESLYIMTEISEKTEKLIDDEDEIENNQSNEIEQNMIISSNEKIFYKPDEVNQVHLDTNKEKIKRDLKLETQVIVEVEEF